MLPSFQRQAARALTARLVEPRRFMQVAVGPRQTGKTTAVCQAVGAYLLKRAVEEHFQVFWWRNGNREVDFVVQGGRDRTAIEAASQP